MNDSKQQPSPPHRNSGLAFLILGMLLAVAGPVIYAVQVQNKSLMAPWYFPILATLGALSIGWSLVQRRTIWRWGTAGLTSLFAAFVWLMMLVGMATPPYQGSVTVGQAFPKFETRLASGEAFQQGDLQGDKNTVLVFYRGHW